MFGGYFVVVLFLMFGALGTTVEYLGLGREGPPWTPSAADNCHVPLTRVRSRISKYSLCSHIFS